MNYIRASQSANSERNVFSFGIIAGEQGQPGYNHLLLINYWILKYRKSIVIKTTACLSENRTIKWNRADA